MNVIDPGAGPAIEQDLCPQAACVLEGEVENSTSVTCQAF